MFLTNEIFFLRESICVFWIVKVENFLKQIINLLELY